MPTNVEKVVQFNFSFFRLCFLYRWNNGYLKICGHLPVGGYCCGQIMNLQLDVINESGQGVSVVMVHFIQVMNILEKNYVIWSRFSCYIWFQGPLINVVNKSVFLCEKMDNQSRFCVITSTIVQNSMTPFINSPLQFSK